MRQELYNHYDSDDEEEIIDVHDYFLNEYFQESLIKNLIRVVRNPINEQSFMNLCSSLKAITQCDTALLSVLDLIKTYIHIKRNKDDALEPIKRMLNLLISISQNYSFNIHFMDVCGKVLIETALYPTFRINASFLSLVSNLLCSVSKELPLTVTHIIGFMFLSNKSQIIQKALELCSKMGIDKLSSISPVINKAFDSEISKSNISYPIIISFIENVPILSKPKITKMKSFINEIFKKYEQSEFNNYHLAKLICSLLNILAPETNDKDFIKPGESNEIDFSLSYSKLGYDSSKKINSNENDSLLIPIPSNLKNKNEFWILYETHRSILNRIIDRDDEMVSKMRFLFDYPELLNFKKRSSYFKQKMRSLINDDKSLSVSVDRCSNVFIDSFEQLRDKSPKEWLNKLSVSFLGERGVDVGGLTREWFTLIVKELFDPKNSLFKSTDRKSYQPCPSADVDKEKLEYYSFAGKIIGRAIIEGICINAHLTRSFYRQILHRQIKLIDLKDYDLDIYNSMESILNNDVDGLDLDFSIDIIENGKPRNILLKKNGDKITVTNKNKKEYVSLYCNYHLRESILKQISAFCEGFDSIIPSDEIRLFFPDEFDLIICGVPRIDVSDLRQNVDFEYPYDDDHPVINLFFNVISKWKNEMLAKFLLFLTGSSQVPVNGFKEFRDCGKPIRIGCGGERDRLCVAHTCFNKLDLYENEDEMNRKLKQSIQAFEFGLI